MFPSSQYSPGLVILSPHFVHALLFKIKPDPHSEHIGFKLTGSMLVHLEQFGSSQTREHFEGIPEQEYQVSI